MKLHVLCDCNGQVSGEAHTSTYEVARYGNSQWGNTPIATNTTSLGKDFAEEWFKDEAYKQNSD